MTRASVVARAKFLEDLLEEKLKANIHQYVILGAGLDTFAERRTDLTPSLEIFEVDAPEPQRWKQDALKHWV